MITRPEARRSGAATALIRALAERATRDGVRELYLLVDRDNDAARPLYAARGFGESQRLWRPTRRRRAQPRNAAR
jgi:ribosomal protein S18 acetylase RimI-like enzyme